MTTVQSASHAARHLLDPVTAHHRGPFLEQDQAGAGLARTLHPSPDHGEGSYRGLGRLTGRRALLLGAESAIGRAVALAYAREGADVVLAHAPVEAAAAQEVAELVSAAGRRTALVSTDVTDEAAVRGAVRTALNALGGLDIVVNTAGHLEPVDDLLDLSSEQFDETLKSNVYALFWLTQEALPHLPPGASIIATGSFQAESPAPYLVDYAATKQAVTAYVKALARQVAERGIRVNAVAPGPVWAPKQGLGGHPTEEFPEFGPDTAFGRCAQPVEVAPAYVFLASAETGFVTGEVLHVDGGY